MLKNLVSYIQLAMNMYSYFANNDFYRTSFLYMKILLVKVFVCLYLIKTEKCLYFIIAPEFV